MFWFFPWKPVRCMETGGEMRPGCWSVPLAKVAVHGDGMHPICEKNVFKSMGFPEIFLVPPNHPKRLKHFRIETYGFGVPFGELT